jgi:hypothetical protein
MPVAVRKPVSVGLSLCALIGALLVFSAAAEAQGCPNESLRAAGPENPATHAPYSMALPDCRAYEQVSPVKKNLSDAQGGNSSMQSSPSGEGVTFSSILPFPGISGASDFVTYLATRGAGGWSTEGLLPESDPGLVSGVDGLTESLGETILFSREPLLAEGASRGQYNSYVRDNATGSYRLLAAGEGRFFSGLAFADASRDGSHILFEDTAEELISGVHDVTGAPYLYEWHNGQLSLAGVLPDGSAPAGGAVAGPGGPALAPEHNGPGGAKFYSQDTISEDGSHVFFSDLETGQIYVREYGAVTVGVSASQRGVPDPAGTKPAYWRAATPDGRYVFFTSEEKLTDDSTASSGRPDLYRFDVEREALEDLTTAAPAGADVLGTLGIGGEGSQEGSYVYFVAEASLASGATETPGQANLYEWHEGATTFIAGLSVDRDEADWVEHVSGEPGPDDGWKDSRVTPDGKTVLFFSGSSLELFSASSGGGPVGLASQAYLESASLIGIAGRNAYLTRNLSEDGDRVFFQTVEAGQMNVHEWERAGEGSCERSSESFSEPTGGCHYLISTGQSGSESYFGEASANGDNVFFFTRQSLVGQEQDSNANLYDARVDGGIAAQNPPAPPALCAGEACLGAQGSPPVFGAPSTDATFSGSGNLTPALTPPASTPATKSLTRAQQLAEALKACKKGKPKKRRVACEKQARRQYAPAKKKGKGQR